MLPELLFENSTTCGLHMAAFNLSLGTISSNRRVKHSDRQGWDAYDIGHCNNHSLRI